MIQKNWFVLAVLLLGLLLYACTAAAEEPLPEGRRFFDRKEMPVKANGCSYSFNIINLTPDATIKLKGLDDQFGDAVRKGVDVKAFNSRVLQLMDKKACRPNLKGSALEVLINGVKALQIDHYLTEEGCHYDCLHVTCFAYDFFGFHHTQLDTAWKCPLVSTLPRFTYYMVETPSDNGYVLLFEVNSINNWNYTPILILMKKNFISEPSKLSFNYLFGLYPVEAQE